MRRVPLAIAAGIVVALAITSHADTPTTGGGVSNVKHDTSLTGSGTTSSNLGIRKDCASSEILKWNGSAWACAADSAGTGDITAVIAGTGLSGGATSGDATLTVNIAGASCGASQAVTALGATGTGTCSTVGDITSVGATANMGLTGGSTSGAATLGLLSTCSDGQVLKSGSSGTTWTCANDNAGSIDGSGAAGQIALWQDSDTLTTSSLFEDSGAVYTAKKLWSSRDDNAGALHVGYDAASSTAAETGMAVRMESGDVKIDTKAATSGSTIFRTGSGTAHGYDNTWLTVAGNGTLDFPNVGVYDVGENNDIAAKFHGPIYLDYALGASQVMHQAMFIGVTATLHNENEMIGYNAQLDGTIDTTSNAVNVMGGQFQAITTRGAGANPVTNYGLNCNAAGGDANYCLYGSAGEIHNVNDISTSEDFVGGANSHLQMGAAGGATESWMQGPTSTTTTTQFYIHSSDLVSGPHTTGLETVGAYTDGTFATGSSDKNVVAVRASATATRASGTGRVNNIAILANASGGQQNIAYQSSQGLMIQTGDAFFAGTGWFGASSDTTISHNAVIGGTFAVTGTSALTGLVTATAGVTTPANLTTTGSGDLVSADDLTVADDATITDTLTVNGGVTLGDAAADTLVVNAAASFSSLASATFGAGLATSTHIVYKPQTLTISCGSGATTIAGSGDERGGVLFSSSSSTCQVTFAHAYTTNAPFCTAGTSNGVTAYVSAVSTSSVTFTTSSAEGSGDKLYYHCDNGV